MISTQPAPHLLDYAPYTPFSDRPHRLPGLKPLDTTDWLVVEPDYSAQMKARRRLIQRSRSVMIAALEDAQEATTELLNTVLPYLTSHHAFTRHDNTLMIPDGTAVVVDHADPLGSLGQLVAEDFCLLQKIRSDQSYRLTAAVLCFPSSWRLADKLGRPLATIHDPVPDYDKALAERVDRVFEKLKVNRSAWRANWSVQSTPELHLLPGHADDAPARPWQSYYLRTERQTLVRLPVSSAVVFGIKTSLCPLTALNRDQLRALSQAMSSLSGATKRYTANGIQYGSIVRQLNTL